MSKIKPTCHISPLYKTKNVIKLLSNYNVNSKNWKSVKQTKNCLYQPTYRLKTKCYIPDFAKKVVFAKYIWYLVIYTAMI